MENKLVEDRLKKLNDLKSFGIDPYPQVFNKTHNANDILEKFNDVKNEEKTEFQVFIAGRIMTFRDMGKASFVHIQDQSGKIQSYVREDEIDKQKYSIFKKFDLGDIIGIKGTVFRTKSGEVSVWAKDVTLLTKSLMPLPEKFHGLKDTEIRYRQRYIDLIVNPDVREVFFKRAKIIKIIREYLDNEKFLGNLSAFSGLMK